MSFKPAFAQENTKVLQGYVFDASTEKGISGVTICQINENSNTCENFTLSDSVGYFSLTINKRDTLTNLIFKHFGFSSEKISLETRQDTNKLGSFFLMPSENMLIPIEVVYKPQKVTYKNDTTVYHADAYSLPEGALTEDLLRELPGMEVAPDGSITIDGKPVDKILVNGEPFFGGDLTVATRNLPKDVLLNVEVTGTKSDQEAFTKQTGDDESKTINLVIKKDKNKGIFGGVMAGYGTDDRYESGAVVNRFQGKKRYGLVLSANNTNTSSNYSPMSNAPQFGKGNGILSSELASFSYGNSFTDKWKTNLSYRLQHQNNINGSIAEREYILPDNAFASELTNDSKNDNLSHQFQMGMTYIRDTSLRIIWRPDVSYTIGNNTSNRVEEVFGEDGEVVNTFEANVENEATNFRLKNQFNLLKDVGKKNHSIGFFISQSYSTSDRNALDFNTSTVISDSTVATTERTFKVNQQQGENGINLKANYILPVAKRRLTWTFQLQSDIRNTTDSRSNFQQDGETQNFDVLNDSLSYNFAFFETEWLPSTQLQFKGKKWTVTNELTGAYRTQMYTDNYNTSNNFNRTYLNPLFKSSADFNAKSGMRLSAAYNLQNTPPSFNQLNPFVDLTNLLVIRTGNPNLKSPTKHAINLSSSYYNIENESNFFGYVEASYIQNQIVSNTFTSANFEQFVTLTNLDGYYSLSASVSAGIKILNDSVNKLRLNAGIGGYMNRSRQLNNNEVLISDLLTVNPSIDLNWRLKNRLTLTLNYSPNISSNRFNDKTQSFVQHGMNGELWLYLTKNLKMFNVIRINYNPTISETFDRTVSFWNSAITYDLFKKRATVGVKVYDLLKERQTLQRTVSATIIENTTTTGLSQYVLFTFQWRFKQF